MLLAKIQAAIAAYRQWLQTTRHHPGVYKWEALQHFQANWNLQAADPVNMFDASFQNSETRRLWQTEHWYPKKIMLEFWKMDPMTVRIMFDGLLNETRDVEVRIGQFLFGCDELLRDYKRAHVASIENNHYHGDYQMISLYLAFAYPDHYAPYEFRSFQKALTHFGARDIPQENDPARCFKVLRTLMQFLEKEAGMVAAMQRHLHPQRHYSGKTLLLAEDFCRYVSQDVVVR